MARVALENGTLVDWDIDDELCEVVLSGADAEGAPLWLCTLPCFEPKYRDYYLPGCKRPVPAPGGFVMITEGEHPRGGTSESAAVHFVDVDGKHLWSHALNRARVAVDGDRLFVVGVVARQVIARQLQLPSGRVSSDRAFDVPGGFATFVDIVHDEHGHAIEVGCSTGTHRFPL